MQVQLYLYTHIKLGLYGVLWNITAFGRSGKQFCLGAQRLQPEIVIDEDAMSRLSPLLAPNMHLAKFDCPSVDRQ